MKILLSSLLGSTVSTVDGEVGRVHDFYFDDHKWTLRYLVCRFPSKERRESVLIPATQFRPKEWDLPLFPIGLTTKQVHECSDCDSDMPVSRQKALEVGASIPWPAAIGQDFPGLTMPLPTQTGIEIKGDPCLRSFQVVRRYRIESSKKALGSMKDFVIEDSNWTIYRLVARLGPWYAPTMVMAAPEWASEIDWSGATIWTDAPVKDWEEAPRFSRRSRPR